MRTLKYRLLILGCALLWGGCQSVDTGYYSSRRDLLGKPTKKYETGATNTTAQATAQTATNAPAKPSP
jgi:PBP1b-binding outer membrane lipoprotein LpoB